MWYGRYVYMTSKSSDCFWYPGSACSMLVSCIWYRDQRKLWSLQASRRKTRLECRLRSASAQINWKTYGWLGQAEYQAHRQNELNIDQKMICKSCSSPHTMCIRKYRWWWFDIVASIEVDCKAALNFSSTQTPSVHGALSPPFPITLWCALSNTYIGSSDGALDAPTPYLSYFWCSYTHLGLAPWRIFWPPPITDRQ